jgi:hypothetical protein
MRSGIFAIKGEEINVLYLPPEIDNIQFHWLEVIRQWYHDKKPDDVSFCSSELYQFFPIQEFIWVYTGDETSEDLDFSEYEINHPDCEYVRINAPLDAWLKWS